MTPRRHLWFGILGSGAVLVVCAALLFGRAGVFQTGIAAHLPADPSDTHGTLATPMRETALPTADLGGLRLPDDAGFSAFGERCGLDVSATPFPGAMVQVLVSAPCRAGAIVRIGHMGLRFDERIPATGLLKIAMPAFAAESTFDVVLADGDRASTTVAVQNPGTWQHVALQWQGDADLNLVTRSVGHASPVLTRLGDPGIADGWRALILTRSDGGRSQSGGVVRVAVSAAITEATCGRDISAATVEPDFNAVYRLTPLTLVLPGCDRVGDILVLKNVLRDLRIAAK